MSKIVDIEHCTDCPYCVDYPHSFCILMNRIIEVSIGIDPMCSLEESKKDVNNET